MEQGHGQQRLTAEQRRRLEEEEERREAEYAEELARQRAILNETAEDGYVIRRVQRQMEDIADAQRREVEAEEARSGGGPTPKSLLLLGLGLLVSVAILVVVFLSGSR
jgi:hypothetical protein